MSEIGFLFLALILFIGVQSVLIVKAVFGTTTRILLAIEKLQKEIHTQKTE